MKKILYIFVIPHLFVYYFLNQEIRSIIHDDIDEMNRRLKIKKGLPFYLAEKAPYRNLFYYRIGKWSKVLRCILRPYPMFSISSNVKYIGGGAYVLNHPYGTIINANKIGSHFTICQLTTLGNKLHGRNDLLPIVGDHVSIGANVSIIGNITIGNNVIIGAGSVIVKDIPSDCVVAGNPARIIRYLG